MLVKPALAASHVAPPSRLRKTPAPFVPAKIVAGIREWLAERDIHLAGRYSEWEYYNSDHAFLAGKKAADTVRKIEQEKVVSKLAEPAWQSSAEV